MKEELIVKPLRLLAMGSIGAGVLAPNPAPAQAYPTKPIRWIIPYSPGGATDISARILSPHMSQTLGQQVIAENRAGGAAIPGFDLVAKAPPDGYTMLLANIAFGANPSLFKKLPFDVHRDFTPVSKITVVPMVVELGNETEGTTPEEASAFLQKEWALWPRIIKEAGIQVVN